MSDTRTEFETALINEGYDKWYFVYIKETNTYQSTVINNMWWAWQAATSQQAERIAQLELALKQKDEALQCVHDQCIEGKVFTQQMHQRPYWRYEVEEALAIQPSQEALDAYVMSRLELVGAVAEDLDVKLYRLKDK